MVGRCKMMRPTLAEEFGVGCSFENRSFKFSSKTGQQIDWGPQGFTFSTLYCFPNLI
jgi:hypothetical protein